jgi:type IV pilus assembly protein PilB
MKLKANRLGEMLLEAGLIDQFQLDSALSMQRNLGGRIGSALVKLGYLPEDTIMDFLESQSRYSRVSLQELEIPQSLITILPAAKLKHLLVVPIELRTAGAEKTLRMAMTDPTNQKLISDLQFATGCRILPELASEDEIRQALKNNWPVEPPKVQEPDYSKTPSTSYSGSDLVDFDGLPTEDPRLDRLLEILQEKGVLSALDVQRVKFD